MSFKSEEGVVNHNTVNESLDDFAFRVFSAATRFFIVLGAAVILKTASDFLLSQTHAPIWLLAGTIYIEPVFFVADLLWLALFLIKEVVIFAIHTWLGIADTWHSRKQEHFAAY